jgi:hypothetical protein
MSPAKKREGRSTSEDRSGLLRVVGYFFPEEVEALDRAAEDKGCSRAEILRRALRAYLDIRL